MNPVGSGQADFHPILPQSSSAAADQATAPQAPPSSSLPPQAALDTRPHSLQRRWQETQRLAQSAHHSPLQLTMANAAQRCNILFGRKDDAAFQSHFAAAAADVNYYLSNNQFSTPLPVQLANVMTLLHMSSQDVHAALQSRWNVLVRENDVLDHDPSRTTNAIDPASMNAKIHLGEIHETLAHGFRQPVRNQSDELVNCLRDAAAALLLGISTCDNHVTLTAFTAMEKLQAHADLIPNAHVKIERVDNPELHGKPVDHVMLKVTLTDQESGHAVVFNVDPWARQYLPVVEEHCMARGGDLAFPLETNRALPNYKGVLRDAMKQMGPVLDEALDEEAFENIGIKRDTMAEAEPGKVYGLGVSSSLQGFVDHDGIATVDPSVNLPPLRRQSTVSPLHNPMLNGVDWAESARRGT